MFLLKRGVIHLAVSLNLATNKYLCSHVNWFDFAGCESGSAIQNTESDHFSLNGNKLFLVQCILNAGLVPQLNINKYSKNNLFVFIHLLDIVNCCSLCVICM